MGSTTTDPVIVTEQEVIEFGTAITTRNHDGATVLPRTAIDLVLAAPSSSGAWRFGAWAATTDVRTATATRLSVGQLWVAVAEL